LHLKIVDGDKIEIKCNHRRCTDGGRMVVLHRFSSAGEYLDTLTFKDPIRGRGAREFRKETT